MATIKDVANSAGCSMMTVSRVINRPEKVNPETRMLIERKIRELGYTPNVVAKSLAENRTKIIYVYISSDIEASNPFFMQTVSGIGERLGLEGYSLLIARKPYESESCDGIIAVGMTIEQQEQFDKFKKKPLVLFGRSTTTDWVDVDNYVGSKMISEYMLDKYSTVAYIGVSQSKLYAEQRYAAFKDCVQNLGRGSDVTSVEMVDNKEVCGFEACERLLSQSRPRAIICATDLLAVGCIRAINKCGLQIPSQIAVAGFDGFGYETLTYPHVTTVRQPVYEAGKMLAEQMLAKLSGDTQAKNVLVAPELVINGSA